jgi:hypothetical protein
MADTPGDAIEAALARHAAELEARGLRLRLELDPRWQPELSRAWRAAFGRLLGWVLATVPDGCEIYVGATRSLARVAPVGEGMLTVRWQVPGGRLPKRDSGVTALHPRPGSAVAHAGSASAARVARAFEAAGWAVEVEEFLAEGELMVRARSDGGRCDRPGPSSGERV